MSVEKISILGCGWTGMALAESLVAKGQIVKGSTTRISKLGEIALAGVIPFVVKANPTLEGDRLDSFFDCDVLIVTLPPPRKEGHAKWHYAVHQSIVNHAVAHEIKHVVLFSSSSVYPNTKGVVTEADAINQTSPHSGVDLKAIEDSYAAKLGEKLLVCRFAGLFGPGRHPGRFLRNQSAIRCGANPVNLTHLSDVVGAVSYLINQQAAGAFNICSPAHPTRQSFYSKAISSLGLPVPSFSNEACDYKEVSTEKLVELGYSYVVENPEDVLN